jgi:prepilin-type processing-associated H-X9-DG protein
VPIHFTCPHCGAMTDFADKYAGETGPCAFCGKAITIPKLEGKVAAVRSYSAPVPVMAAVVAVVAVMLVGVVVLTVLLRSLSGTQETAWRLACADNLKQIAQAMRQYEVVYGSFPPAYVPDKHGKPLCSWRVLLLPYLGQQALYDQYHLDEPWNSPNNRPVSDLAIGLFQCPAQPDAREPVTYYVMVVGQDTISSGRESRKITDITDGLADTIMLVEVADSTIRWAEPEDLHFDRLNFTINGSKRQAISSYHRGGVNAAFCDGSVRFLSDSINPQLVKAMLTIGGGEPIPREAEK